MVDVVQIKLVISALIFVVCAWLVVKGRREIKDETH